MALALAQAGADIVLVQRASSTPNIETRDRVSSLGRKVHIVECDLADKAQVKGLCKKVTGSEGEGGLGMVIDIVVNCGGIQRRTPAENFPDEDWDEVRGSPFSPSFLRTDTIPNLERCTGPPNQPLDCFYHLSRLRQTHALHPGRCFGGRSTFSSEFGGLRWAEQGKDYQCCQSVELSR
jgi:NAD(P)-dependent dehydrogenase (short-subunit alcohol dehydrogenase family)